MSKLFLRGANLPWNNYGWDYGLGAWGHGYDSAAFEKAFAALAGAGGNCVRLWVFGDGRYSPQWSSSDSDLVEGLNDQFLDDFDDMVARAERYGLRLVLVLWDFLVFNSPPVDNGTPTQGGHARLFTEPDLLTAFLDNCLIPLVARYTGRVFAWDIMNEPEWVLAENPDASTDTRCDVLHMQQFIGRCAAAIHSHGQGALVTVGSASVKWSWDSHGKESRPDWCHNYWGDDALHAACQGDPGACLDIYQIHFYPWMKDEIDPFEGGSGAACYTRGKPLLIGEVQANLAKQYAPNHLMDYAKRKGYAGVLFWSYQGVDDKGSFVDFSDSLVEEVQQ